MKHYARFGRARDPRRWVCNSEKPNTKATDTTRETDDATRRRGIEAPNDAPRLLRRDEGTEGYAQRQRHGSEQTAPRILKFVVDTTTSQPNEPALFAEYLATKCCYVDCWDADSRLHIGTASVTYTGVRSKVKRAACPSQSPEARARVGVFIFFSVFLLSNFFFHFFFPSSLSIF